MAMTVFLIIVILLNLINAASIIIFARIFLAIQVFLMVLDTVVLVVVLFTQVVLQMVIAALVIAFQRFVCRHKARGRGMVLEYKLL